MNFNCGEIDNYRVIPTSRVDDGENELYRTTIHAVMSSTITLVQVCAIVVMEATNMVLQ